ncbi:Hypothetical protein DPCES_5368 [Desulfitobacterium hafniense]|uniref:Uncharacterized protein n=1 Tax=Desulfitobacterium hafniense TaxID=49338 RepID=A0A098AUX2_DESHA|nr:hypothetical protein [Desulfitobacterium hafniense]CDV96366.1 Hypothetical protein DPCES_5368 [Desulfitobacterium hafniense]
MTYEAFFNDEAIKLIRYSVAEKSRIKASRYFRAACNMERQWRKHRGVDDSATVYFGGCIIKASSLRMIWAETKWRMSKGMRL